jgi:hypothetical protein
VRFAFIAAREVAFPVDTMCRVLSVSRSGYYAWSKRPVAAVKAADVLLVAEIAGAHKRSRGIYGSPRVHSELRSWRARRQEARRAAHARTRAPRPTKASFLRIPIDDQVPEPCESARGGIGEVACDLGHPLAVDPAFDTGDVNASGLEVDDEQHEVAHEAPRARGPPH